MSPQLQHSLCLGVCTGACTRMSMIIKHIYRNERGLIGGTNVIAPFPTALLPGTICMSPQLRQSFCLDVCTGACTMMSYMSLWSIPIDWRDLVTKTYVGTSITTDESRWRGKFQRYFIYLAYFYSKESIRNAVTEPAWPQFYRGYSKDVFGKGRLEDDFPKKRRNQ